jgi:hypothetical protein
MRAAPLLVASGLFAVACVGRGCDSSPLSQAPVVTGPDGRSYRLLDRGGFKGYYDEERRLQVVEYDADGDGKVDYRAYYEGRPRPARLEIDTNRDGRIDRWEEYDADGRLEKLAAARRGTQPDWWAYPGPDGTFARIEHDTDHDGTVDRVELFEAGRLLRVEVDGDRDGRIDRWQDWSSGRLTLESLDTDGDGVPDRRLRYGRDGQVEALEPVS